MWMISKSVSYLRTIFFPASCFLCKRENTNLCFQCLDGCRKSLSTPYPYIISIFDFRDPNIKKIIHSIKYYSRKDLINQIVEYSFNEIDKNTIEKIKNEKYIISPIPMPIIRKYKRGYNQAELISKEYSKLFDIEMNNKILKRKLFSKRQVETTSRQERLKNQKNTFIINADVKNISILLIDDVTTTGSTFEEARNLLMKHGAKKVIAISLAH